MLVHFVNAGASYLPELEAYARYLAKSGHTCQIHHQTDTIPQDAAAIWWMCGLVSASTQAMFPDALHVHEYASASIPPLAAMKDLVKRFTQATPHHRIYQNPWVKSRLGFRDNCTFDFRDMGLADYFLATSNIAPSGEYDFVYLGEMSRLNVFKHAIDAIVQSHRTLLLIGEVPENWFSSDRQRRQIGTTGRIRHQEVRAQLARARCGLNLVPPIAPYTEQTSTKLLEYCAAGLPVASIEYPWAKRFELLSGGRFFWLPQSSRVSVWVNAINEQLPAHNFVVPELQHLNWEAQLSHMSIWQILNESGH